jgi:hypothetical protein
MPADTFTVSASTFVTLSPHALHAMSTVRKREPAGHFDSVGENRSASWPYKRIENHYLNDLVELSSCGHTFRRAFEKPGITRVSAVTGTV